MIATNPARRGISSRLYTLIFIIYTPTFMFFGNLHIVEEGRVYRTGRLPVKKFEETVERLKIRSLFRVICLHRGNREYFKMLDLVCEKRGIRQFVVSLTHNRIPDKQRLAAILEVFDKAEYPLLIMCWRGADRSGLTSALYKMYKNYRRDEVMGELSLFPYGHLWFLHLRYHIFLKGIYDHFGGNLQQYLNSDKTFTQKGSL